MRLRCLTIAGLDQPKPREVINVVVTLFQPRCSPDLCINNAFAFLGSIGCADVPRIPSATRWFCGPIVYKDDYDTITLNFQSTNPYYDSTV